MNGIFIIPTGIGCSIGGHAGDAVCAVNLIASMCDNLIVNPNAVNASDINEMAANCLYVEGSHIDTFLGRDIFLERLQARQNKILLLVNKPVSTHTVNSVNAARVSLGIDIEIVELNTPLVLTGKFEDDGSAGGEVVGWEELLVQVGQYRFDALAIQTAIDVENDEVDYYLKHGGVNPWGGVEAKASRLIASQLYKPLAHAPFQREDDHFRNYTAVVNPRLSAEMVSVSYLHSVLKGLSRAPRVLGRHRGFPKNGLRAEDFDFLVTPDTCFGTPHTRSREIGIEVIVVRDNKSVLPYEFPSEFTFVKNYIECAGYIACKKLGMNSSYVLSGSLEL